MKVFCYSRICLFIDINIIAIYKVIYLKYAISLLVTLFWKRCVLKC